MRSFFAPCTIVKAAPCLPAAVVDGDVDERTGERERKRAKCFSCFPVFACVARALLSCCDDVRRPAEKEREREGCVLP